LDEFYSENSWEIGQVCQGWSRPAARANLGHGVDYHREAMKQEFGLVGRPGDFYLKNKIAGQQTSLNTNYKHEARRILQAHNDRRFKEIASLWRNKRERSVIPWASQPAT
jgi:hypothetical protein